MLNLPKKNSTVIYDGLAPVFDLAGPILAGYFLKKGLKCLVTSANDGKHSVHSAHYFGHALDLRSQGVRDSQGFCIGLINTLNTSDLAGTFYVVWEGDHIHLEWAAVGAMPNIVGYKPGKYFYDSVNNS